MLVIQMLSRFSKRNWSERLYVVAQFFFRCSLQFARKWLRSLFERGKKNKTRSIGAIRRDICVSKFHERIEDWISFRDFLWNVLRVLLHVCTWHTNLNYPKLSQYRTSEDLGRSRLLTETVCPRRNVKGRRGTRGMVWN